MNIRFGQKRLLVLLVGGIVAAGCSESKQTAPAVVSAEQIQSAPNTEQTESAQTATTLPPELAPKAQIVQLRAQIMTMTENKSASHASACRVTPLGHKACGGVESYIAYSTEHVDEQKLLEIVKKYNQVDAILKKREKQLSTCDVTPEQFPTYQQGLCNMALQNSM